MSVGLIAGDEEQTGLLFPNPVVKVQVHASEIIPQLNTDWVRLFNAAIVDEELFKIIQLLPFVVCLMGSDKRWYNQSQLWENQINHS